jgi:hypothetical protein
MAHHDVTVLFREVSDLIISRRPEMGSDLFYACPGNAPQRILQTLHAALFSPFYSRYILLIINKLQKNLRLNPRKFHKVVC